MKNLTKNNRDKIGNVLFSFKTKLGVKGETSGHYQHVQAIRIDCDQDTILLEVKTSWCGLSYGTLFLFL